MWREAAVTTCHHILSLANVCVVPILVFCDYSHPVLTKHLYALELVPGQQDGRVECSDITQEVVVPGGGQSQGKLSADR